VLLGLGSDRERKFILFPKVKGRVLGIYVLCDTFVMVLLCAPLFKMYLVKPIFCRYCRNVLVTSSSAEMTEGYIDTLLDFQIFSFTDPSFHIS